MPVVFRFFMCFSKQTSPSTQHPFQQTNSVCCWGLRVYTHLVLPSLVAMVHTARRGRGMWCHQSWPLAVCFSNIWCFMLLQFVWNQGEFINYHLASYNIVLPKLIRMDCRCVYVLFSKLPVLICRPATQTEDLGCKFATDTWQVEDVYNLRGIKDNDIMKVRIYIRSWILGGCRNFLSWILAIFSFLAGKWKTCC